MASAMANVTTNVTTNVMGRAVGQERGLIECRAAYGGPPAPYAALPSDGHGNREGDWTLAAHGAARDSHLNLVWCAGGGAGALVITELLCASLHILTVWPMGGVIDSRDFNSVSGLFVNKKKSYTRASLVKAECEQELELDRHLTSNDAKCQVSFFFAP